MESILIYYLIIWEPLGYVLAFIGTVSEGDASWFIFAFLTGQGFYNLGLMLLCVFGAAIVGDTIFYWLGRKISKKDHRFIRWAEKVAKPFDSHLKNKLTRTLAISKFTYGGHKPILIRVGMIDIPYWHFLKKDIPAILVWELGIGVVGYFSGVAFYALKGYLHYLELGVVLGLILFFIIMKILSKYSEENL
ncbi:MAG: VTT domain-containing protein [Candidatus Vogelbacteria bacterium]|nr:VTT domain-containing protein [Candidatus Vogelbacteria bacterium]